VKIEETMMQCKPCCILVQKDAMNDANLRLGQWKDTEDPGQLMNGILAEITCRFMDASVHGCQLLYLALPRVKLHLSANLH